MHSLAKFWAGAVLCLSCWALAQVPVSYKLDKDSFLIEFSLTHDDLARFARSDKVLVSLPGTILASEAIRTGPFVFRIELDTICSMVAIPNVEIGPLHVFGEQHLHQDFWDNCGPGVPRLEMVLGMSMTTAVNYPSAIVAEWLPTVDSQPDQVTVMVNDKIVCDTRIKPEQNFNNCEVILEPEEKYHVAVIAKRRGSIMGASFMDNVTVPFHSHPPTVIDLHEGAGVAENYCQDTACKAYWAQLKDLAQGSPVIHRVDRCERILEGLRVTAPDALEYVFPKSYTTYSDPWYRGVQPILKALTLRAELPALLNSLKLTGPGAELGVLNAGFSREILTTWKGGPLHLVDLWEPTDSFRYHRNFSSMKQEMESTTLAGLAGRYKFVVNSTWAAAGLYPDNYFDFLYIDAGHTYRAARLDLMLWWPKVRAGGLVAGHDYVNENNPVAGYRFGVRDAVDEFAQAHNIRVHSTKETHGSFYMLKC